MTAHKVNKAVTSALEEAQNWLLSGGNPLLLSVVQKRFPEAASPFLIDFVPEQSEDLYWLLISPDEIVVVEIPRESGTSADDALVKVISVGEYSRRSLMKESRRKLEAARYLLENLNLTKGQH